MDGLFKVISVGNLYPSRNDEQLMLRDVVLKSYAPRVNKNGVAVGWNSYAVTLFGDEAERFNVAAGNHVVAELYFNVRQSQSGACFTSISLGRYCQLTDTDWKRDLNH